MEAVLGARERNPDADALAAVEYLGLAVAAALGAGGDAVVVPLHTAPARATRASEFALGGAVRFAGFSQLGNTVYRREPEQSSGLT